ncbi:MAG: Ribosomal protein [Candidatus Parcubacteria bacterium]|jgi:large subunit ribosomal protein L15
MYIHTLSPDPSQKVKKRIGRGGKRGTYSGKGQKGQKARSGAKISPLFTGGSASLSGQGSRVIHKRRGQSPVQGHHRVLNIKGRKSYKVISIQAISSKFEDGSTINLNSLIESKLISNSKSDIKVLATNRGEEIKKKFVFEGVALSKNVQDLYSL